MTERSELQNVMVVKLREQADFLKHNVATWQLLARAADEIEWLRAGVDDERERCANIADSFTCGACGMDGKAGAAIRNQS